MAAPADACAAGLAPGTGLVAVAAVQRLAADPALAFDLPEVDAVRIARCVNEEDRAARRAAWRLARHLLGTALDLAPDAVPVERATNGRPRLALACDLDFNLSHSGGFVAVGLMRGGAIGVDVERVRPLDLWTRLAGDFMAADDHALWLALPVAARAAAAHAQWCGKEAVLKATGEGLVADARTVRLPADGLLLRAGLRLRTSMGTLDGAAYAFAAEAAAPRVWVLTDAEWQER